MRNANQNAVLDQYTSQPFDNLRKAAQTVESERLGGYWVQRSSNEVQSFQLKQGSTLHSYGSQETIKTNSLMFRQPELKSAVSQPIYLPYEAAVRGKSFQKVQQVRAFDQFDQTNDSLPTSSLRELVSQRQQQEILDFTCQFKAAPPTYGPQPQPLHTQQFQPPSRTRSPVENQQHYKPMLTDSRFEQLARSANSGEKFEAPFAESKSRSGNNAAYFKPHFTDSSFVKVDLYTPEQNQNRRPRTNPLVRTFQDGAKSVEQRNSSKQFDSVLTPKRDVMNRPEKRSINQHTNGIFGQAREIQNIEPPRTTNNLQRIHTPQSRPKSILSHSAFGKKNTTFNPSSSPLANTNDFRANHGVFSQADQGISSGIVSGLATNRTSVAFVNTGHITPRTRGSSVSSIRLTHSSLRQVPSIKNSAFNQERLSLNADQFNSKQNTFRSRKSSLNSSGKKSKRLYSSSSRLKHSQSSNTNQQFTSNFSKKITQNVTPMKTSGRKNLLENYLVGFKDVAEAETPKILKISKLGARGTIRGQSDRESDRKTPKKVMGIGAYSKIIHQ